ncbi:PREDICTED: uncharacterized protein LOC104610227 [Nelumbo nucifera]|uniref:Uncharacterized protein LOC104610227 n=1 Tax=Nelumbo nucifera TaxID=4432 RepID=A0A1U8BF41_NELNU|nr:PREDICTED: uncharacterized protein LOC104610227 [Nelumbo nucifera]
MSCFVPFNDKNLDISLFVFRSVVVIIEDLMDALKQFSVCCERLGCAHCSIFKSIHGNMIVWYGAWLKRSDEQKKLLDATLMSMLQDVSSMAILLDHSFFNAYAGESKDGFSGAKFSTGDTVSLNALLQSSDDSADLSYLCLALFKSYFLKMEGVTGGVCFKCDDLPRVVCLYVWKSLHSCYSWLLTTDIRRTIKPYLEPFSPDIKYDIFRVVYVRNEENMLNTHHLFPSPKMQENVGNNEGGQRKQQGFEKSEIEV